LLLSLLAVVPALLMPLAATCQAVPDRTEPAAERVETPAKYEVFAGYGYTSLNQVNQSRYGLQGPDLSVTRYWGRFFGFTADGAYYKYAIGCCNPSPTSKSGKPSVDTVLLGPVLHANLYGRVDGFFHVLLGGEHTGGEGMHPKVSFAGGIGIGMDYKLNKRFALRASGDDIISSFVSDPNNTGASPHEHGNSRAALGLVYKF
jgi:hypothetical protein